MFDEYYRKARAVRRAADNLISKICDTATDINDNIDAIREWKPGVYSVNDVRVQNRVPYRCVQPHDSTGNDGWDPEHTAALWAQYHGTTAETARPFVHPTGAHDMYLAGEYVVWTDGTIKRALISTIYSPSEYAQAWADVQ